MKTIDKLAYIVLAVIFGIAVYIGFTDLDYFNTVFTVEDGIIEYSTALLLFSISILCIYRYVSLRRVKPFFWTLGVLGFALLFFFGGGEEISWGQRLFNIESGDFFIKNNAQHETNLHNLVVGGKKINKIIFSQLLMGIMIVYLIAFPIAYRYSHLLRRGIDHFAIPVVKWHHTFAFITATILVVIIPADRKWEVYELAFGVLFFLIFLYPLNFSIYKK